MQTLAVRATGWILRTRRSMEDILVECNAWFLVFAAVLLSLAFSIYAGLTIWCLVYKDRGFTGLWSWSKGHVKVRANCR